MRVESRTLKPLFCLSLVEELILVHRLKGTRFLMMNLDEATEATNNIVCRGGEREGR
jgi:hypothetical protein